MRGDPWHLRQRPKRTIQVVFYIPGQGDKAVVRSTGTRDEKEAQIRAGEIWVKEMRAAGQPIPEDAAPLARVTVEDAVAEFLVDLEQKKSEHREQYVPRATADLKLYVLPKSEEVLRAAAAEDPPRYLHQPPWIYVDEITSAAWENEKPRLHKSNDGPLGYSSIRHLANTLRHLLRFCVSKGYLENEPVLKSPASKLVKKERRFRRAMSSTERERFMQWLYKYSPQQRKKGRQKSLPLGTAGRFYEVLHFALQRRGEAWAATLRWIDRKRHLLHMPPEHTKSGDAETIPLHPRAEKAFLEQARVAGIKDLDTPIFGVINVRPAFEWALAKAKVDPKGITPHHHARHASATILAQKTKSRDQLKRAGRWRSDQSIEPYLHVEAEDARQIIEKL